MRTQQHKVLAERKTNLTLWSQINVKITRILRKILTVLNYKYINQKIVQKHQSKNERKKKERGENNKQATTKKTQCTDIWTTVLTLFELKFVLKGLHYLTCVPIAGAVPYHLWLEILTVHLLPLLPVPVRSRRFYRNKLKPHLWITKKKHL